MQPREHSWLIFRYCLKDEFTPWSRQTNQTVLRLILCFCYEARKNRSNAGKQGRESVEMQEEGESSNQSLQSGVLLNPAEQCSLSSIIFLLMTPSRAPSPQTVMCASLRGRFIQTFRNISSPFQKDTIFPWATEYSRKATARLCNQSKMAH